VVKSVCFPKVIVNYAVLNYRSFT